MAALDRLGLREKTLVLFTGDNGTAHFGVQAATVNGRHISGQKGTMLEGGSRVPLICNWRGTTPAGKVLNDLVDFSDFFATFADLGGAPLNDGIVRDSHSFAPQLRGEPGTPRDWIYVELNGKSYARDARYKLTNTGLLYDLRHAPFEEIPVPADTTDDGAIASRKKLQEVLNQHPTAHGNPNAKAAKKQKKQQRQK
jgi:arylsulfatase A-like enzyme